MCVGTPRPYTIAFPPDEFDWDGVRIVRRPATVDDYSPLAKWRLERDKLEHKLKLAKLGLPDKVIEEVVRAEENHLFDSEPSPDLVERTIDELFPKNLFVFSKKMIYKIVMLSIRPFTKRKR